MDAVLDSVVQILSTAGGSMEYPALYTAMPFEHKARTYDALRYGKQIGRISKKIVRNEDGSNSHVITLLEV